MHKVKLEKDSKRFKETFMTLQFRLWALTKTQEGTTEHYYNQKKDVFICSLNLFWQHVADRAEGREERGWDRDHL